MRTPARLLSRLASGSIFGLGLVLAGCAGEVPEDVRPGAQVQAVVQGDSPLAAAFNEVQAETGVPAELLASIAFVETRFSQSVGFDGDPAHGAPRTLGVMALSELPERDVVRAAALAGRTVEEVTRDPRANILAAARLLGAYAAEEHGDVPTEIEAYRGALGRYAGDAFASETLADDVLSNIERGIRGADDDGLSLLVPAHDLRGLESGIGYATLAAGTPGTLWNPASTSNYANSSRSTGAQIKYIVIHTVQGSYSSCISWFKNPSAKVSAHYVVRSSDGQITQMVDDSDVAWHDACFNTNSIGIEHEGFIADPGRWYSDAMYRQSARLVAWLADRYGIPKDRAHILGHGDAPDCSDHTDPGSGWNWTKYMDLVRGSGAPTAPGYAASLKGQSAAVSLAAGEEAVVWVEFKNDGSASWDMNDTRLGTTEPQDRDSAFYKAGNWISRNRPTGADAATVPGGVGRFSFVVRAPAVTTTTTFHEKVRLVQEGVTWFGPVVDLAITVRPSGTVPVPVPTPTPTPTPVPTPQPTTCYSATLAKDVGRGTCVQSASDAAWYKCSSDGWIAGQTGCTARFAWCQSATLGAPVAPRTCVQAASDSIWYQCNGTGWVSPVSSGAGPAGRCSTMYSR